MVALLLLEGIVHRVVVHRVVVCVVAAGLWAPTPHMCLQGGCSVVVETRRCLLEEDVQEFAYLLEVFVDLFDAALQPLSQA